MENSVSSRECIIEAFLQLCKTTPCDRISVSQLTKKAGYNRSTFYAHFKSIDDLLLQLEENYFAVLDEIIPEGIRILRTGQASSEEREMSVDFFHQNVPLLVTLLGPNGDPRFVYKFKNHIKEALLNTLQLSPETITPQAQLLLEFCISGHLQMLFYCHEHNSSIHPLDFWLKIRQFIDPLSFFSEMLSENDKP